jgi:hypothetical protein
MNQASQSLRLRVRQMQEQASALDGRLRHIGRRGRAGTRSGTIL